MEEAVNSYYHEKIKNDNLSIDFFENAILQEIYNRFSCRYNISDTTIISSPHSIKTVLVANKTYSIDFITNHIILNLKEVLNNSAELLQINFNGIADSCEQIQAFLQAE